MIKPTLPTLPTLQPEYRRSGGLIRQMVEQGEVMAKPTLEQYGLTQAEIDRVEPQQERFAGWSMGLAGLAWAGLMYYSGADVCVLATIFLLPVFGGLGYAIYDLIAKYSDTHQRVAAFNDATGLYEAWLEEQAAALARTQREFWTSLTGREFEIELANLYTKLGYEASLTATSCDGG